LTTHASAGIARPYFRHKGKYKWIALRFPVGSVSGLKPLRGNSTRVDPRGFGSSRWKIAFSRWRH
jgi:hypothetical protein